MRKRLYQWRKSKQLPTLNTIFVSKEKIVNNLHILHQLQANSAFFPVLKSNAYGHGITTMLEIFKGQDFPYLIVDSFPEYQIIHHHSTFKILLIGETLAENYRHFDFQRTTFAIYNIATLKALGELNKKISIHLFLNTGMNREGIQEGELIDFLSLLKHYPKITLEGVMSHFHSADQDFESINQQVEQFKSMHQIIIQQGFNPLWKHISASAGILNFQDPFFNACRPGLALYGYGNSKTLISNGKISSLADQISPALRLESSIISLQSLLPGEGVSYNQHWKAKKETKIATIPFGYYEGWPRSASGKLIYKYQGYDCPQIGTICMNLSSCLAHQSMQRGDRIELISDQKNANNSIQTIAQLSGSIPYEILIRLDKGIRRVITL